jgi:hypothetical protein
MEIAVPLSFIFLALLIFAQIFSDHFSSAASFASIYSSSVLIRDDRLIGELLRKYKRQMDGI